MRPATAGFAAALLLGASCGLETQDPGSASADTTTLFEGARVIPGDGGPHIEDAAFLVEDGRFVAVGRRGEVQAPRGAARVDLSGRTVIPALVDGHSHVGYWQDTVVGPVHYTRENILDHMERFAYHGVAASLAMGSDFGELPFEVRDEILAGGFPNAARFLTAGRGLAPLDEIRPTNMRHAAYPVTTEEGARAAVRELATRNVTIVKTWVDDRGGSVEPLAPDLYRAIIDEAHGLGIRVAAHATGLDEAKDLLRAGLDVFAHMIEEVDDELVELFRERPDAAVLTALAAPGRAVYAPWLDPAHPLLAETVSPELIRMWRDRLAGRTPEARERARERWDRLAGAVVRLHEAGVRIGLGSDGGGMNGGFIGWTAHAEMENLVAAGLSPGDVIRIATANTAEILGLDDLGAVAPGKSADFIVLDGNPLEDITRTRRIDRVYLRGREVDRAALRDGWRKEPPR